MDTKRDKIELTLEQEVASFLRWIGYDDWKDDVAGIVAYGDGPTLNKENGEAYELGTDQFRHLAETYERVMKERAQETGTPLDQ